MYNFFKNIAKRLFLRQLLKKNESFFRHLISLRYKGNFHQCNICKFSLSRFVVSNNNNLLCPKCGSLNRTRRLYKLLNDKQALKGNILHFSPPKSLYNKLKTLDIDYFSSDFENEFAADYSYNITDIPIDDDFFDTIICYHVLEHIEDDIKAISELYRVLKPKGTCYIQAPFKDGDIFEDFSITTPEKRKKYFGQEDHVRIYSLEGLRQRLNSVGFKTKYLHCEEDLYFGFKEESIIIVEK